MFASTFRRISLRSPNTQFLRAVSTLPLNPNIYVFPHTHGHLLSLLPTDPPHETLAIGTTTVSPPTPSSLTENPRFLSILDEVLAEHAYQDPGLQGQAAAFASTSGSSLGSGGSLFPSQRGRGKGRGDGAGGASSQGGAGGGGRGGWVHLSDERAVPDYGRIAWPEDMFGSVEVDAAGNVVEGSWSRSGTYRVITREGILGLSGYLRGKVVERLREEEKALS